MTPEKNNQTLTRWLLIATIALLVLVLGLQLWQLFGKAVSGNSDNAPPLTADASTPENPQAAGSALSPGKSAMIEDVRALNEALSANELAKLSTEELEQLWETGAPGLPVGMSFAAQAAEEYAGTLAVDSVTSETDPELDEAPPHYEVELHHPTLGDFSYKIDAYTGEVLDEDWEDEFDSPTLQVYFDILLTACYDVDDDMGLGYMWDAVNDLIAELDVFDDSQVAVLGRELIIGDVQVDPGMMGLGLVDGSEVPGIRDVLCNHRDDVGEIELDNLSDDVEPEECIEAYDDLCNLYEEAADQGKGLLFAF